LEDTETQQKREPRSLFGRHLERLFFKARWWLVKSWRKVDDKTLLFTHHYNWNCSSFSLLPDKTAINPFLPKLQFAIPSLGSNIFTFHHPSLQVPGSADSVLLTAVWFMFALCQVFGAGGEVMVLKAPWTTTTKHH